MKKALFVLFGACLVISSCWKGDTLPESDQDRHIITDLKAVPGDEEIALSWSIPEGWNPTDFIINYTGSGDPVEFRTGKVTEYTITDLTNGTKYTINVQAVYGEKISAQVSTTATPATTRIAVSSLDATTDSGSVTLSWEKPSTNVLSYKINYYVDGTSDIKTATAGKDATSYTVTGLTDDLNYVFEVIAVYAKGDSEPCTIKAMPTTAIPYTVDRTSAAVAQPITFTFNRSDYPDATGVKWTFPDGSSLSGDTVKNGITSVGTKNVILEATVKGVKKQWTIELNIREYVVYATDFYMGSTYNGFKGGVPVFSPDGKTLYMDTFYSGAGLYAYDLATGAEKWRFIPEGNLATYNPCTVNPVTGDIYFGMTTGGNFFAVKPDGSLKWKYEGLGSCQSAAPAVNKDGSVVFAVDAVGKTVALDAATGAEKWTANCGAKGGGLLVNGDELVVGVSAKTVYFLDAKTGAQIKVITLNATMTDIAGFAVSADKTILYVPQTGGCISSINLKTKEIIVDSFKAGANNMYEPVVSPVNGDVFVGSKDSNAYCIDKNLTTVKWKLEYAGTAGGNNAFNYSHPCVDSEGNFYITSGQIQNQNFILTASGAVKEQWQYDGSSNKQMGGNNYLDGVFYSAFIGAKGDNGALIGKYVGGERGSGWSTHGGDICGSCCLDNVK